MGKENERQNETILIKICSLCLFMPLLYMSGCAGGVTDISRQVESARSVQILSLSVAFTFALVPLEAA